MVSGTQPPRIHGLDSRSEFPPQERHPRHWKSAQPSATHGLVTPANHNFLVEESAPRVHRLQSWAAVWQSSMPCVEDYMAERKLP